MVRGCSAPHGAGSAIAGEFILQSPAHPPKVLQFVERQRLLKPRESEKARASLRRFATQHICWRIVVDGAQQPNNGWSRDGPSLHLSSIQTIVDEQEVVSGQFIGLERANTSRREID